MHCELVVPGLFAAAAAARAPALELLLARGRGRGGESQRLEGWLREAFGVDEQPLAAGALTAADAGEAFWARADPVHLRLMRDRLMLVPAAAFSISAAEAAALCEALNRHFPALAFAPVEPSRWCVRLAEPERLVQPALEPLRLAAAPAAAREQQLERRRARRRRGGEEARHDELAVHQTESGTTRTPGRARWRSRMR